MAWRRWQAWSRAAAVAGVSAAVLACAGCAKLGYYWQSASGHLSLMHAARPVPQWLADPATGDALKARLQLAQRIRRFAVTQLALHDNASYTEYADLHRSAAVWNVVAAPPYALTLKTWCFPVAGCVGYRGYYDEAAANTEAAAQRAEGLEVVVYPVPAYSTLGWLNWAGGDPLLSTFINYPEGELARIVFHELAHQLLYVADDTAFNESFATAIERIGGARWLEREAGPAARAEYAEFDARRRQFRALTGETHRALAAIYAMKAAAEPVERAQAAMKKIAMDDFRAGYARLRARWTGPRQGAYDAWVARANNASFAALSAYDDLVPAFEALYEHEGRDWPRFHAAVRRIAALPQAGRREALMAYSAAKPRGDTGA